MPQKTLLKYAWKPSTIAKVWVAFGWEQDEKKAAEKISRRFSYILREKLNMNEDEIKQYMSDSSHSGKGHFLFAGTTEAPKQLKELIDIFYNNKFITMDEMRTVRDYLHELLPPYRTAKEFQDAEKLYKQTDKIYKPADFNFELSDFGDNVEKWKTEDRVKYFYMYSRTLGFFEERVFYKAGINQDINIPIYGYQYQYVKCCAERWNKIMNDAAWIRKTERFDNGYEKLHELGIEKKDRKEIYKTGKWENRNIEDLLQDKKWISSNALCNYLCSKHSPEKISDIESMSEKTCLNRCEEEIKKIVMHKLKKIHEEDFICMRAKAFEELENVRRKIIEMQHNKIYQSELDNIMPDGLNLLYDIRKQTDKYHDKIRLV